MKEVYTLEDLRHWDTAISGMAARPVLSVIGDPVAHSKSPQMHNPALAAAGVDGCYIRLHLTPQEIGEALPLMAANGFLGTNVTIPHKAAALAAATQVDPVPRMMGAVNTLRFGSNGEIRAWNTDGPGFVRAVEESLGAEVKDLRVAIIGAGGGAGRGVAVQCAAVGCPKLVLINRTVSKVAALREELSALQEATPVRDIAALSWEREALERVLPEVDLIVNGTSLGMKPKDEAAVPGDLLGKNHLIYDMVYSGGKTPLLSAAEKVGAKAANGLPMLLHQGAISFEHWFGRPAPLEEMRAGLLGT